MAASDVQICNLALLRIGVKGFIQALDDDSTEAQACKIAYEDARDAALEQVDWSFARKHATLELLANVTRSGWQYAYQLPKDCLAPRYIWNGVRNPRAEQMVPYAIEADDALDTKLLLTDQANAELIYTAGVTNARMFTPMFRQAAAWRLASEIALGLGAKRELFTVAENMFRSTIAQAIASMQNQEQEDLPPEAAHIAVRE